MTGIMMTHATMTKPSLAIVSTGLVLYLDAGNTSSYPGTGTVWTDISGNGYTGSMTSAAMYSSTNGGIMTFNGTNQNVSVTDSSFTSLTNNFSVEYWYYSTNNQPGLQRNGLSSSGYVFGYFNVNPTKWKVTKYGVVDIYIGSIPQNTAWHQAVLTYSSTAGTTVYIDGAQSGNDSGTTALKAGSTFYIGQSESVYHSGGIGIVRWYNTALTLAQVSQNFNATRSRYGI